MRGRRFLAALRADGAMVTLSDARDGRLVLEGPPGFLTDELLEALRPHRDDLKHLVRRGAEPEFRPSPGLSLRELLSRARAAGVTDLLASFVSATGIDPTRAAFGWTHLLVFEAHVARREQTWTPSRTGPSQANRSLAP